MKADYYLENDEIKIGIASHGAELVSLKKKEDSREYMWSGDERYWNRVSPVLFPFVGKLRDGRYVHQGQEFCDIPQHGFARDRDFSMVEKLGDVIWFEMRPDEELRSRYPFEFLLRIGYRIEGRRVHVMWTVRNDSADTMYFSIGGHPAFLCSSGKDEADVLNGYRLNLYTPKEEVVSGVLNEKGTLSEEKRTVKLTEGKLDLSAEIFGRDALILDAKEIHTVGILDPDGEEFLRLQFDVPQLGIWSPAGKNAPFVCVEPWFGRCDAENFSGVLSERQYGNATEPGHSFHKEYVIECL